MEISRDSLSADFETGWKRFETSASLRDSYSTDLLLSVLRRKFSTKVEIIYTHFDFVALRVDLSEIKVRVSAKSLVCLIRIKKGSIDTAEAFRLLTTAHFADSPAGYCTIAIVCGESNELKSKCRSSFLDLVILDYKQMKSIITAEEWSIAISRVLGEEKSPRILSPYDETGICPAEMFFGRDEELQRLTSHARGHGYSLVGCRRVGKSSLLLRIKRHYDERGETTYYIDCQTCHSTETFYDEIVKRTNRRDYESRKKWTLKGYLMRLASISRKPLNLFLDEMDWVVAWDKTNKYQYIIKELLSAERTTVPIRVWMAGFKDLYWAVTDRDGPLYGKSNAVELKPLPYNKVKDLILKPSTQLGYEFENKDSIINRIYSDAAGHPSFTQLYCRLLVDVMTEEKETKIKIAHLDGVGEKNELIDYVMDTFVINTSPLEKMIVLSVLDKKGFTQWEVKELLSKYCGIKLNYDSLYKELRDLRFGGILLQKIGSFSFQYPIMTKIIKNVGNPDYLREEYIEEAKETAEKANAKMEKPFR